MNIGFLAWPIWNRPKKGQKRWSRVSSSAHVGCGLAAVYLDTRTFASNRTTNPKTSMCLQISLFRPDLTAFSVWQLKPQAWERGESCKHNFKGQVDQNLQRKMGGRAEGQTLKKPPHHHQTWPQWCSTSTSSALHTIGMLLYLFCDGKTEDNLGQVPPAPDPNHYISLSSLSISK